MAETRRSSRVEMPTVSPTRSPRSVAIRAAAARAATRRGSSRSTRPIHPRLVQKAEGNDGCLACARFSLEDRSADPGEGDAELLDDVFDRKPGRRRLGASVHGPEYGNSELSRAGGIVPTDAACENESPAPTRR